MSVAPTKGPAGTPVHVTATGLPANTAFALVWQTERGSWVIRGAQGQTFDGRAFTPVNVVVAHVTSSASGSLETVFHAPAGFGADHTVMLMAGGVIRNQALFDVTPSVTLARAHGVQGSPIAITMTGIGAQSYTNSWLVLYDNRYTGWISAVTTNGTAHLTIPAAGAPGTHVISIIHGAYTFPYLNSQQSPHPKPEFHLVYTVTAGTPQLPPAPARQGLASKPGAAPAGTARAAWTAPASGAVGTTVVVHARNLPPRKTVEVRWQTVVGSRVTAAGWKVKEVTLGKTATTAKGTVAFSFPVPDDVGGVHTVSLVGAGGRILAHADFTVNPTAVGFGPNHGPDGTIVTIHLRGVGWTETANIYTLDYDDSYVGYACGFNSHGDVTIHLAVSGAPGWHFIDLYPGIYKGTDLPGTNDFRLPQLTYALDHPGGALPAFRFAFDVTKG